MSSNREKTSGVMGIAVSVLLHGIFFAGCLALDAASVSATGTAETESTEIQEVNAQADVVKVKS